MTTTVAAKRHSFRAYLQPKTLLMLALGFSSGIPFFLVGNTLSYWLAEQHISLTAIGFASGVGLAYSLKFLWAPLIDRLDAPFLGFLGRRRGWILLAQIFIALGLIGMAAIGLNRGPLSLVALALVVAFSSATQDIVIDAWRIESAGDNEELGLLTSTATFGYRMAVLATDALILIIADHVGWAISYGLFGVLTVLCMAATLMAPEPRRADAVMDAKEAQAPLYTARGLFDAVAGPFIAFMKAHGWIALLMLAAIALYRLPDFVMGPMANPFYIVIGIPKAVVGEIRATIGLGASLIGIAAGGFFTLRFGHLVALIVGGILQATSIAAFALLAHDGTGMPLFFTIMAADSFSTSFAGIVLVAYMSSLTTLGYTATQYALLASAYSLIGKLGKIVSGVIIDHLKASLGLLDAYAVFFIAAGLIGIPGVLLFVLLARLHAGRDGAGAADIS
ncbi:MAG TPA: MFS transporter [Rhizomicrobium sp.]|nr:MFS transporter [Rhizomicrobium sp.]